MWSQVAGSSAALVLVFASLAWIRWRSRRGPARVAWLRLATVVTVIGLALAAGGIAPSVDLSTSDAISVIGLVVSLAFGFLGGAVATRVNRPVIGVVIPSRASFHRELRAGLRGSSSNAEIYDEYDSSVAAREDLTDFLPLLQRVMSKRPDYLVLCAPGVGTGRHPEVDEIAEHLVAAGGAVFAIESGDFSNLDERARSRVSTIRTDAASGIEALVEFLRTLQTADQEVLLISGPSTSKPATERARRLAEALPGAHIATVQGSGWSGESAVAALRHHLQKAATLPDIVVAGNDDMAVACSRFLTMTSGGRRVRVIGFDGTLPALVSISDPSSPLVATVRVPPTFYGQWIGSSIHMDFAKPTTRPKALASRLILLDGSHVVTKSNVWNHFE
jgi:ABC-type sugar transport system substrate-binding protein